MASNYEQVVDDLRHADNLTADHRILALTDRAASAIEELTKPKQTDYSELVKALRRCDMKQGCFNANCRYSVGKYFCDMDKVHKDAAAAIEELQAKVDTLKRTDLKRCQECLYLGQPVGEQLLPKRGKWIGVAPDTDTVQCSVCGYNLYSEELETPYCPWCGAKMEVQE